MPTGKVGQNRLTPIRRMMSPRENDSNMMYSVTAIEDSKMLKRLDRPRPSCMRPTTDEAAAMKPQRPARIPVWKSGACIGGPSTGPISFMSPVNARMVECDARLVEIEKCKPRAVPSRRQRRGAAKRVALRRFDFLSGSAEIGEQTCAIARRGAAPDLDNPQMRQRAHHAPSWPHDQRNAAGAVSCWRT